MTRPAGVPNKNKSFLLKRLQDMYGDDFHPIMRMAENAVTLEEMARQEPDAGTIKAALDGWDKIAQYTEPKLKSIEVSGDVAVRPRVVDLSSGKMDKETPVEDEQ